MQRQGGGGRAGTRTGAAEEKSGSGLLAVVALLVLAGGAAFAYVKFIKPNRSGVKVSADPDEYDFEDEEYLTEDVADFEAEVK